MSARPAPDPLTLAGALVALAGYLLPWFRRSDRTQWSFSGWEFATLSSGGGWTLIPTGLLVVAVVAALWARASSLAVTVTLISGVAAMMFALIVVAASFAEIPPRGNLNWIADLPFEGGLVILALGFGTLLTGGVRAMIRAMLNEPEFK